MRTMIVCDEEKLLFRDEMIYMILKGGDNIAHPTIHDSYLVDCLWLLSF